MVTIALLIFFTALLALPASACPSCYGQAQGPAIDGMNNAIGAMIGIVGFVLSGFVAMFIAIGRRARTVNNAAEAAANEIRSH